MRTDLIADVLIVFASLLVPGAGICLATRVVRSRSFLTFVAVSLAVGFAATALASLGLALLGILGAASIAGAWIGVSVITWVLAVRSGVVRADGAAWVEHAKAHPWSTATGVLTVAGIGVVRWTFPPISNMGATAMRYWADALEIADVGRIPAETLQWGALIRPATSKSVLNAFNAGASLLIDRGPLDAMGVLLFVVSIALALIVIALFTELGIVWLAPIGALFLLANEVIGSELTADLTRNLAENWGRLAALAAVLLSVMVLRPPPRVGEEPGVPRRAARHERWGPVVTGGLLGAAIGTHLVAAAVGALLIVAFALGRLIVRAAPAAAVLRILTILAVALVLGVLVLVLPRGDLGFGGATGDEAYGALRTELGLAPTFDPTRFIVTGDGLAVDEPVGVGDVAEAFAYRLAGRNVQVVLPGEELPTWALTLPSLIVAAICVAVVVWGPRDLRVAVVGGAIAAGVVFLVGAAFALRYDLFALERFGNRRLFNYAMLPYVILVLAGGESAARAVAARGRTLGRIVPASACALALATGAWLLPAATWPHEPKRHNLHLQIELLRWIGSNVPCEGRILADRRTLGTFQVMTGHAAVLEGMGPHVRPEVLARAIAELLRARAFFEDPAAHRGFLTERGVVAVVTTKPYAEFAGWARVVKGRPERFQHLRLLRIAYRSSVGVVYLVRGAKADAAAPAVVGRAGFHCPTR